MDEYKFNIRQYPTDFQTNDDTFKRNVALHLSASCFWFQWMCRYRRLPMIVVLFSFVTSLASRNMFCFLIFFLYLRFSTSRSSISLASPCDVRPSSATYNMKTRRRTRRRRISEARDNFLTHVLRTLSIKLKNFCTFDSISP